MKYIVLLLLLLCGTFAGYGQITAAAQAQADERILQEYFTANHIVPQKTASGAYYVIHAGGSGPYIHKRQSAYIMYTGKLLSGKVFDSNTGGEPLQVHAGMGEAMKGMDETLLRMKYKCRATVYVPSALGYGSKDDGGIPANSILVFDMEIVDVK